jgi:hypothetical protein
MSELDTFDTRLEAAVHAFADRAETRVDAAAMAERAVGHRRSGMWSVLDRSVPVPVSLLLVLGLLLGLLLATLGGGAPRDRRFVVVPATVESPAPTASPTPARTTDGQDEETVVGTEILTVVTQPKGQSVASVRELRGGVAAVATAANDPRVSGTGTWQFDQDAYASVGPEWGTYHLQNEGGSWDGDCQGGTWSDGNAAVRSCWLTGSEAYDGYSYFFIVTQTSLGSGAVEGVIYPGSPVEP